MRDILLFDVTQFLYDAVCWKIVEAFFFFFFSCLECCWLKGCMLTSNSKLQTEFPLSSFHLNSLIFPSGFHVLQNIGNDCGGSQRRKKKTKKKLFFLKSVFFLSIFTGVRFPPMDGVKLWQ